MKSVKFNCEVWEGYAIITASVTGVEYHEHFPYKETFFTGIEFLDAKEEVLGGLRATVAGMLGAVLRSEEELETEREAYDA